ncbi:MAG: acyl-phosphate glycerol 3-phosphate acyltransferase [Thermotogae bacterium]|nr:MAG: acyl-phosphate glycerol 3-phosphate acyltransferase [Thermotogota bacterium]
MVYFLTGIVSYLCGSIPFSFILPKLKDIDIRTMGSGNVGGTNALRAAGARIGLLCMILDALKAFIPVLVFSILYHGDKNIEGIASISAVLGHDFSIFLKFRGGKGVASTTGVYFALFPISGAIFLLTWFVTTVITKYVSLASILALYVGAVFAYLRGLDTATLFIILATLSTLRHSENIRSLLKGAERKTYIFRIQGKGRN